MKRLRRQWRADLAPVVGLLLHAAPGADLGRPAGIHPLRGQPAWDDEEEVDAGGAGSGAGGSGGTVASSAMGEGTGGLGGGGGGSGAFPVHGELTISSAATAASSRAFQRACQSLTPDAAWICYKGGDVLARPNLALYLVWYGDWDNDRNGGDSGRKYIRHFINSLGMPGLEGLPSPNSWWQIVRQYADRAGTKPGAYVTIKGEYENTQYSQGRHLGADTSSVFNIVIDAINAGALPFDPNGAYVVLTSDDVTLMSADQSQSFCGVKGKGYCGWHHQSGVMLGPNESYPLTFTHVGNAATQCAAGCIGGFGTYKLPNSGYWGVDGIVSILAHELAELVTNPDGKSGWTGNNGEIGDMCSFDFGAVTVGVDAGGQSFGYNMASADGSVFLIQRLWNAFAPIGHGSCAVELPKALTNMPSSSSTSAQSVQSSSSSPATTTPAATSTLPPTPLSTLEAPKQCKAVQAQAAAFTGSIGGGNCCSGYSDAFVRVPWDLSCSSFLLSLLLQPVPLSSMLAAGLPQDMPFTLCYPLCTIAGNASMALPDEHFILLWLGLDIRFVSLLNAESPYLPLMQLSSRALRPLPSSLTHHRAELASPVTPRCSAMG
ncbi:unnamed protein product [Closterium sp. Yama58-4]|nr:unnamed protein product [Closterium sp. Yama58-4]